MLPIDVVRAADAKAEQYNIPSHRLLAVVEVESNGQVFAEVAGKQVPVILFEPHVFYRLLPAEKRAEAVRQKLASKRWNRKLYPKSQEGRWAQLERAKKIDREAALMAASYGVGQVLGLHWKDLGFKSVDGFITEVCSGAAGQIEVMMRYIMKHDLDDELRAGQWASFARGYNGKAYKKNKYDTKMAEAAARYSGGAEPVAIGDGMLRMGSKGKRVREMQRLLVRAGYAITPDGDFGNATRDALKAFQKTKRLTVDGVYGPKTEAALSRYRQTREEDLGATAPLEVPEAKPGLGTAAGGVLIEVAQQKIDTATEQLQGVAGGVWVEYLLTGMTVLAGVVAVAGLAYWGWGFLKSLKTEEV